MEQQECISKPHMWPDCSLALIARNATPMEQVASKHGVRQKLDSTVKNGEHMEMIACNLLPIASQ